MTAEFTPDGNGCSPERRAPEVNGGQFSPETMRVLKDHQGIHAEVVDDGVDKGKRELRVFGLFVPKPETQWEEFERLIKQLKEEAEEQQVDGIDFVFDERLTPALLADHGFTFEQEAHSRPSVIRRWHARLPIA